MKDLRSRSTHWKKQLDQGFGSKPADPTLLPSIIEIPRSQVDSSMDGLQMEGHGWKRCVLSVYSSTTSESKKTRSDSKGSQSNPSKSKSNSKSVKSVPLSTAEDQSKSSKSSSKSHPRPPNTNTNTNKNKNKKSRRKALSPKLSSTKSGIPTTSVQPTFQNPIPLLPRKQVYGSIMNTF